MKMTEAESYGVILSDIKQPQIPLKVDNNKTVNDDNHKSSPPASEKSHNISIISLEDGDDVTDSSLASDSDLEDVSDIKSKYTIENIINNQSNGSAFCSNKTVPENGMIVISQRLQNDACSLSAKPNIGSIALQNSTDITFGNKTFYQGPVTIKQFMLENNKWRPSQNSDGTHDNPAYQQSNGTLNTDGKRSETSKYIIEK